MDKEKRLEIIEILEDNSKITPKEIAVMLNITEDEAVHEIEELEREKIIVKYAALIDHQKLDDGDFAEALIEVKITPQLDYGYDDMARRIYQFEEVQAVYLMAGAYDLCVRAQARSMRDISKFVFEKLAVIEGVTSTVTLFIMRKYKENGVILVDHVSDDRLVVSP